VARNTVIVDDRPASLGLLRTDAATAPPCPVRAEAARDPGHDLVVSLLDASTGGRTSAAVDRVPTPPFDHRPYTPQRIQEVIGPFLA
jgi:hypothetical protein